jgi:DNA-binding transcriptional regulator/RsmH inhibitor MraZ
MAETNPAQESARRAAQVLKLVQQYLSVDLSQRTKVGESITPRIRAFINNHPAFGQFYSNIYFQKLPKEKKEGLPSSLDPENALSYPRQFRDSLVLFITQAETGAIDQETGLPSQEVLERAAENLAAVEEESPEEKARKATREVLAAADEQALENQCQLILAVQREKRAKIEAALEGIEGKEIEEHQPDDRQKAQADAKKTAAEKSRVIAQTATTKYVEELNQLYQQKLDQGYSAVEAASIVRTQEAAIRRQATQQALAAVKEGDTSFEKTLAAKHDFPVVIQGQHQTRELTTETYLQQYVETSLGEITSPQEEQTFSYKLANNVTKLADQSKLASKIQRRMRLNAPSTEDLHQQLLNQYKKQVQELGLSIQEEQQALSFIEQELHKQTNAIQREAELHYEKTGEVDTAFIAELVEQETANLANTAFQQAGADVDQELTGQIAENIADSVANPAHRYAQMQVEAIKEKKEFFPGSASHAYASLAQQQPYSLPLLFFTPQNVPADKVKRFANQLGVDYSAMQAYFSGERAQTLTALINKFQQGKKLDLGLFQLNLDQSLAENDPRLQKLREIRTEIAKIETALQADKKPGGFFNNLSFAAFKARAKFNHLKYQAFASADGLNPFKQFMLGKRFFEDKLLEKKQNFWSIADKYAESKLGGFSFLYKPKLKFRQFAAEKFGLDKFLKLKRKYSFANLRSVAQQKAKRYINRQIRAKAARILKEKGKRALAKIVVKQGLKAGFKKALEAGFGKLFGSAVGTAVGGPIGTAIGWAAGAALQLGYRLFIKKPAEKAAQKVKQAIPEGLRKAAAIAAAVGVILLPIFVLFGPIITAITTIVGIGLFAVRGVRKVGAVLKNSSTKVADFIGNTAESVAGFGTSLVKGMIAVPGNILIGVAGLFVPMMATVFISTFVNFTEVGTPGYVSGLEEKYFTARKTAEPAEADGGGQTINYQIKITSKEDKLTNIQIVDTPDLEHIDITNVESPGEFKDEQITWPSFNLEGGSGSSVTYTYSAKTKNNVDEETKIRNIVQITATVGDNGPTETRNYSFTINSDGEEIANRAEEIANKLEQGFWNYWNYSPDYPELFNWDQYEAHPNHCVYRAGYPPGCTGSPNEPINLFWCTHLVIKSYNSTGHYVPNYVGSQRMMDWFSEQGRLLSPNTPVSGLKRGMVVFFEVPSVASGVAHHVAIITAVGPNYISIHQSNSSTKTATFSAPSGIVQNSSTLNILGFGTP